MKYSATAAVLILLLLCSCSSMKNTGSLKNYSRALNYPAGSVSAQIDKLLSNEVQKKEITVLYYPDEDAVCLRYRASFVSYYQFWYRDGREAFVAALERYKDDYEQRRLKEKSGRKERRVYGTVKGFLGWQVMELIGILSGTPTGPVKVDIGYSFQGKSKSKTPYFTITQNEAEYQDRASGGRKLTTVKEMLFLTRAQAEELAAMFNQEYLLGLEVSRPETSTSPEVDVY